MHMSYPHCNLLYLRPELVQIIELYLFLQETLTLYVYIHTEMTFSTTFNICTTATTASPQQKWICDFQCNILPI